jgi:hypothetical protein
MRLFAILAAVCLWLSPAALAKDEAARPKSLAERVEGLQAVPGFLDLYVDPDTAHVYAALPAPGADGVSVRFIYTTGLTAGLGSNPIGLDRGNASGGDIVRFRKIGDRVIAEQENWRYRASSGRAAEEKSVKQSFATSFLWSTGIEAKGADGRLLVDLTGFLTRDAADLGAAMAFGKDAGSYSLAADRSLPDPASVLSFPDNSEIDAFLTFETSRPNAQTRATAADARAVTLVLHHSFVRLPEEGYTPREFDQRTASIGMGYYDFSNPLGDSIVSRLAPRFRLQRVDPAATSGPVTKPIVFYVDNGAPPEIRDALIEGASWWAKGFEAAGFENAYRVEVLPEDAHPLDVRYNVINWGAPADARLVVWRKREGPPHGRNPEGERHPRLAACAPGPDDLRGAGRRRCDGYRQRGRSDHGVAGAHPPAGRARSGPYAGLCTQFCGEHKRARLGDGLPCPVGAPEGGRHAGFLRCVRRGPRRLGPVHGEMAVHGVPGRRR